MSPTPPRIIYATIRGVEAVWAIETPHEGIFRWLTREKIQGLVVHQDSDIDWDTVVEYALIPGTLPEVVFDDERGYMVRFVDGSTIITKAPLDDDGLRTGIRDGLADHAVLLHRQAERAKTASLKADVEYLLAGEAAGFHGYIEAVDRVRAALAAGLFDGIDTEAGER